MKTIWKFPVEINDEVVIEMPVAAKVLCVQMQGHTPCIWAMVQDDAPKAPRKFGFRGTGHNCGGAQVINYIGTVQTHGGALVFHLFELD